MPRSGREGLPDVREFSRVLPGYPGVIGSFSRMSRSSREVLKDVRQWSGGPFGCLEVVGRSSRIYKCSACPPVFMGVVGRPSRISKSGRGASGICGSGREALPDAQEWS